MKVIQINKRGLCNGIRYLEAKDKNLKRIIVKYGPPPLWEREQGFKTLIHILLEQQVSLASAKAAYDKLLKSMTVFSPDNFLKMTDIQLKQIGFSRQKMSYGRNLSRAIIDGSLDLGWSTRPELTYNLRYDQTE